MTNARGVFDLRTPDHLLAKLQHDFQRMSDNPADSYAAFDFFVTAFHMKDWLKGSRQGRTAQMHGSKDKALFEVCGEIANGSKHFEERLVRVEKTELSGGAFDPHVFDPAVFDVGRLTIHLSVETAKELGLSTVEDAITVGRQVLDTWERNFALALKLASLRASRDPSDGSVV